MSFTVNVKTDLQGGQRQCPERYRVQHTTQFMLNEYIHSPHYALLILSLYFLNVFPNVFDLYFNLLVNLNANFLNLTTSELHADRQKHKQIAISASVIRTYHPGTLLLLSFSSAYPFSILRLLRILASLLRPRRLFVISSFLVVSSILIWASTQVREAWTRSNNIGKDRR